MHGCLAGSHKSNILLYLKATNICTLAVYWITADKTAVYLHVHIKH